jgi:hypothetical protein
MGWMCSWLAVQGAAKADVFDALDVTETVHLTEPGTRKFGLSYRQMPGDWLVVFAEDFDWASSRRVLELSRLGLTIGCQFEDKVEMANIVWAAEGGVELWRVAYRSREDDGFDLETSGDLPAAFDAIRERQTQLQREEDAEDGSVDLLHDIGHELALAITGYRADEELAEFTVLEGPGAASDKPERPPRGSGGLFSKLFGRKREP